MSRNKAISILILLAIITLVLGYYATQVKVDYEFETFFPAESEEVAFFQDFREKFETDNDFLMLGIKEDKGVFTSEFLNKIKELEREIRKLDNVNEVIGGTSLRRVKKEPLSGSLISERLLNISDEEKIIQEAKVIQKDPMLTPVFFSKDQKNINIIIKHTQRLSVEGCDTLVLDLKQLLEAYHFQEYHLSGRAIAQSYYVKLMRDELFRFSIYGTLIVIIFLIFTYRNWWSIFVPLLLVAVSSVWTIGLMTLLDKSFDIMLVVLPTLIFIVGVSDVLHLYTKFLFMRGAGLDKREAVKSTMNDVGTATLLTSLTTAIGFASLYFVQVPIIREFGMVSAMGVIVTFVVVYAGFMAFLTLSPEHYFSKIMQSDKWNRKLKQAFIFSIRNGKKLLFGSAVLFLISWVGIRQLEQKNKLFEELPDNSPLLTEINYFNEHFVGTRPFEMALELRHDSSFFDYELLLKMDALDDFLIHEYEVEYLISPSMVVKKINLDIHNGDTAYFNLPEKEEVDRIARFFTKKRFEREMSAFIDNKDGMARISARVHDNGSDYFKEKNAQLAAFFREEGLNEYFDYTLTGSANMIDRSNEVLAEKLIWGLLAAFAMIAILLGIIFQSLKMIAVVLFINIIPLFGVAGLMGFLGVDLKISTSVIFTIAFGIAVDDTIHFLSKYRLARKNNISLVFALKNTYLSTGRAIILTSFVLIGGFISLLLSDFKGTYYIGLLVSGTLVMALLTDLLILPFLLYLVKGKDGKL